jgi:hypothetical protein
MASAYIFKVFEAKEPRVDTVLISETESRTTGETESRAMGEAEGRTANTAESRIEEIEEMLACFSLFYLRPQPESWSWLEQQGTWRRFIGSIQQTLERRGPSGRFLVRQPLRSQLKGQPLSVKPLSTEAALSRWLLKETGLLLEAGELSRAPRFETQLDFARKHLVGGLPVSVLPIESLHSRWTWQESASLPFARQMGLYNGDAAAHMASLLQQFELTVTGDVPLSPDHLTIELSFLGLLLRYGSNTDVHQFIDDHLSWLPNYLDILPGRVPNAPVFIAITILLNACLETLRLESLTEPWQAQGRGR